jgi:hypothetical protein
LAIKELSSLHGTLDGLPDILTLPVEGCSDFVAAADMLFLLL